MELRQLEYFAAVARHGSFTRAAGELYVTQSALSQQIRRLEAEVGVELLRRTSRGALPTAAGQDLLAHAEAALAAVARGRAQLARHAGARAGQVRVAAAPLDAPWLPLALAAFHRAHPDIQIALRHAPAAEVLALAQRRAVDVGVASLPAPPPDGVRAHALPPAPLRAMAAADDVLAGLNAVALGDLRGRPFILPEPDTVLRATVIAACQAAGFSPVPLLEVSDPATARTLAHAGLGVSVVPAAWLDAPGPAVAAVPLAEPAPRHHVTLLAPVERRSPAGSVLLEALLTAGS